MATAEYTVRLDAFEGPLDLLLFLIRRAEVEITDIPVAKITRQYMAYLDQIMVEKGDGGALDIEDAGEFLVMAATLMEIKSRMLAPPTPVAPNEAHGQTGSAGDQSNTKHDASSRPVIDPRAELVKQLLDYKRYRDAASRLDHLKHEWEDRYAAGKAGAQTPAAPAPQDGQDEAIEARVDVGDLTLIDLVEAFSKIIETVDMSRVGSHRVVMDDTPVELHAEDLLDRLLRRQNEPVLAMGEFTVGLSAGEMDFREVFQGRSRSEAIGLFLAVLELVKQQRVGVKQDLSGRIVLGLKSASEDAAASSTGGAGDGGGN